jgi:HSP20 family protein
MSPTKKIWLPQGVISQTTSKQRAGGVQFFSKGTWTPDTDIYEVEDGLVILVDIAGVKKEEIQVVLEGQILSISGTRKEPAVCKRHIHRLEIDFGHFERTFRIPYAVTPEKVEARYEDGFLYLWLPKQPDDACIIDITIA